MRTVAFGVLLLLSASGNGQVVDSLQLRVLSPQEMQEDFGLYTRMLMETHPGLYRYQTKQAFEQHVNRIETEIKNPLPFYDFYRLLAKLNAEIRCAHTSLFPVEDVMNYMNYSSNMFPFFMYPIDDKMYVLFSGTEDDVIKPGYELVDINGKSISVIRNLIQTYHYRDGNVASALRRYLQGGFFTMSYYYFVEQPDQFDLTFLSIEGDSVKVHVPAQPYKVSDRNYLSNAVNKKMLEYFNKKSKNWGFEILDDPSSTALLHFRSFGGKGMDNEDQAQLAMQEFMKKALKKMEKKVISNLIIELRGNTGGWDIQGKELFSYLMKSDAATFYYKDQYTVTKGSEFLVHSDLSTEDIEEAANHLIPQENGMYKMATSGNATLLAQEPKKNRFKGNVYILLDEQCASSCSEFVGVAKSTNIAILVGNEGGGAYEGGNGGSFINFQLPNSGISSNSPLVKYEMAVQHAIEKGRGTIPHHRVMFAVEDILSGRDPQKEYVLDLIRNKN